MSVVEDGAGGAGGCYGGVAGVPRPAVEVRVVLEGGLCLVLGHPCLHSPHHLHVSKA